MTYTKYTEDELIQIARDPKRFQDYYKDVCAFADSRNVPASRIGVRFVKGKMQLYKYPENWKQGSMNND